MAIDPSVMLELMTKIPMPSLAKVVNIGTGVAQKALAQQLQENGSVPNDQLINMAGKFGADLAKKITIEGGVEIKKQVLAQVAGQVSESNTGKGKKMGEFIGERVAGPIGAAAAAALVSTGAFAPVAPFVPAIVNKVAPAVGRVVGDGFEHAAKLVINQILQRGPQQTTNEKMASVIKKFATGTGGEVGGALLGSKGKEIGENIGENIAIKASPQITSMFKASIEHGRKLLDTKKPDNDTALKAEAKSNRLK